nr:reverse transcriptase domain-containing protein [Tanacetum cinerariifolium]
MKLNPKTCAFGMREGTFLGYKVDADGLRVSPDKVKAVLDLPSPKCLKDVQKLNEKLASLNRFLSKSAKKSLPFFKTLKMCTKKNDFQWNPEAEGAFKEMKQSIAKLLMLTAPKEKEELIITVLMTERDGKQVSVYFVSRALQGPEINYTLMEKLILTLVSAREHDIQYRPRTSVKGQILADFIVERMEDGAPDTPIEDREELWTHGYCSRTDHHAWTALGPEKREQAAIQEARNKAKKEGYYNARVRSTSFRPEDFVYRNNEASHAKDGGKLRPKWEGPYEVTEALGKGAYRLRDRNGHTSANMEHPQP